MFDGLRSRCVMPRRCASATASQTGTHDVRGLHDGERPGRAAAAREILAVQQLHHEVAPPGVLADVADVDDVRVANARRQLRFLQESSARGRHRRERRAENLDREALAGRRAHGLVDGAHRSDADEPFDLVLAEPRSCAENRRPLFHRSPFSFFSCHIQTTCRCHQFVTLLNELSCCRISEQVLLKRSTHGEKWLTFL